MPSVLLTRPENRLHREDLLHIKLKEAGIETIELPMLRFSLPKYTSELDAALIDLADGKYDIAMLSSPTAVEFLEERAQELGIKDKLKGKAIFGTVGAATALHLQNHGYELALPIPANAGSRELFTLITPALFKDKKVLLLQSQIGLDALGRPFRDVDAIVERVVLYETKGPSLANSARLLTLLEGTERPDVITFTSPSAVSFFIRTLAEMGSAHLRDLPPIACIGETTARAIEESLRRRPEIVARKADQASLAEDILHYLRIH